MQNEPNFKNTKINLTSLSKMVYSNFHPLQPQKNEPNLSHDLSIVACLPSVALMAKEGTFFEGLWPKKSIAECLLKRYDGRQIDFFLELILTNIGKNENGRETEDFGD